MDIIRAKFSFSQEEYDRVKHYCRNEINSYSGHEFNAQECHKCNIKVKLSPIDSFSHDNCVKIAFEFIDTGTRDILETSIVINKISEMMKVHNFSFGNNEIYIYFDRDDFKDKESQIKLEKSRMHILLRIKKYYDVFNYLQYISFSNVDDIMSAFFILSNTWLEFNNSERDEISDLVINKLLYYGVDIINDKYTIVSIYDEFLIVKGKKLVYANVYNKISTLINNNRHHMDTESMAAELNESAVPDYTKYIDKKYIDKNKNIIGGNK